VPHAPHLARLLGLVLLGGLAVAADVRVSIRVTSAAGSAVYVDRGSANGLAEGDRVEFRLETGTLATGIVRSLGENSARVEMDPGSGRVPVGTRGDVVVPDSRPGAIAALRDERSSSTTTAHPPWTHPPETWNDETPLLAPAFGIAPEDRVSQVTGRAWFRFGGTYDVEGDRKYGLAAVGTDVELANPFGDGGSLRLDVEAFTRTSDVASDDGLYDYDQSRVRLDRLAYTVGGTEDRPDYLAFGRFFQAGLPELGLLDGAEWSHTTRGGSEFGASFGWLPNPYTDRTSFDDTQASVSYRYAFDPAQRATVGVGYQNTWHDGEQDRNLIIAQTEVRPSDATVIRATAWVDLYDSNDTIKGSGAELTEARITGSVRIGSGGGIGFSALERRIPELLRDEFLARRADDIKDSVLDRIGLNGWTTVGTRLRFDARVEHWFDQDDDGVTGELAASYRDLLGLGSSVSGAVLWIEGSYNSGPGARLQLQDTIGTSNISVGWQSFWFTQPVFTGDDDQLAQHSLFGSLDVPLSDRWDLTVFGDRTIGDELDAWAFGIRLQTHF
jgi:hypothetical protein